ncbi:MAG: 50S ribosomal protein L4, partial [Candidatus Ranarchaeia archaeon]
MVKIPILGLDGKVVRTVTLSPLFKTVYRPDVIRRSFLALQSLRYQPQGVDPRAGKKTTAASWG